MMFLFVCLWCCVSTVLLTRTSPLKPVHSLFCFCLQQFDCLIRFWLAAMSQVYPEDRGTNYSIKLGMDVARQAEEEMRRGVDGR